MHKAEHLFTITALKIELEDEDTLNFLGLKKIKLLTEKSILQRIKHI